MYFSIDHLVGPGESLVNRKAWPSPQGVHSLGIHYLTLTSAAPYRRTACKELTLTSALHRLKQRNYNHFTDQKKKKKAQEHSQSHTTVNCYGTCLCTPTSAWVGVW